MATTCLHVLREHGPNCGIVLRQRRADTEPGARAGVVLEIRTAEPERRSGTARTERERGDRVDGPERSSAEESVRDQNLSYF